MTITSPLIKPGLDKRPPMVSVNDAKTLFTQLQDVLTNFVKTNADLRTRLQQQSDEVAKHTSIKRPGQ